MSNTPPSRRTFLMESLLVGLPLSSRWPFVAAQTPEPWLENLQGRHRQFFDVSTIQNGAPLRRVFNFVETYATAYRLAASEVNALFGAHGRALPIVLDDRLWQRFGLGARYDVVDPLTTKPAERNIFLDVEALGTKSPIPRQASIRELQRRNVRFLACNNTIRDLAEKLAIDGFGSRATLETEIVAGVVPGAMVVPAMLIAANRAQESGLTYCSLG